MKRYIKSSEQIDASLFSVIRKFFNWVKAKFPYLEAYTDNKSSVEVYLDKAEDPKEVAYQLASKATDLHLSSLDTPNEMKRTYVIASKKSSNITASLNPYGDDDAFWTREDLDSLGNWVAEIISDDYDGARVDYDNSYLEGDGKHITVGVNIYLDEDTPIYYEATNYIDMRKIRNVPGDLNKVYGPRFAQDIENECDADANNW